MALTTASFTESSYYEGNGSTASDTLALDPGMVAGDWTILACALTASSGTITTPTGWTAIQASTPSTASASHCAAVFAKKWVAGDPDPVVNHSSGRFAAVVVRVQSADAANFLDVAASADTTAAAGATSISAPSKTPTTSSAVMVTVHTARTNVNGDYITITAPTGMTLLDSACSFYTGSNAAVGVSVVAVGSGVASGTKSATTDVATNGAIGISFVVKNSQGALTSVTSSRSSAWNVQSRITDTQTSAWNVLELAHITATRASAWSVVGRVTDTCASSWNVRSETTKTASSAFNVNSAVGGGAPLGIFMVRYVAYAPNGARRGVLGQPFETSAAFPVNDTPGLQIGYSTAANGYSFIATPCEIALEWSINGSTWSEAPNGRFVRIKRSDDSTDVTGRVSYDCPGYVWLLSKARIYANAAKDNADGQRPFANARPGTLLRNLIDEAKARGALAGMTYDFTEGLDSAGQAWTTTATMAFDIGADLLTVLNSLADQGIVDFCTQGRVLRVFNPNTYLARDVTTGTAPVTLRLGREISDAPDTGTLEDVATDLVVLGDNGVRTTLTNLAAVSPWGRWESFLSQSGVSDVPTMTTLGQAALYKGQQERVENTRSMTFANAVWLPFNNYRMGDFIKAPADDGTLASLRIMNLTLTTDSNGIVGGSVTLNDRFMDKQLRDSRRLAGITNGALGTAGTGKTPVPVPGKDKTIPATPAGLAYTTSYYQQNDGTTLALVNLSWGAVTTNNDGTTMTDFRGYDIWQRQNVTGAIWHRRTFIEGTDTTLTLSPFDPGSQWQFVVKARDVTGNESANSNTVSVTMAADTTGPNAPSTPVVTPYLGQLIATWDGKDSSGAGMPNDWSRTEVHMSATTSGFTPDSTTLKGAIIARGAQFLLSGLTYGQQYYIRLVAYDRNGNASPASAQATGIPTRIANVDVGDGTINGVKIQPGTITAAMALFSAAAIQRADIALLAVDDARIANLSVGKLTTGELAATTRVIAGQDVADHAEMRADGFAVVTHDVNGDPVDVVRMGNATSNYFTIPDPNNVETTLASIDEAGNAAFQGLDVSGVDDTNTGATIYGRDFSDWMDSLPAGEVAQAYATGSTTPIDATADLEVAEVSFQFTQGRHYKVTWAGMHCYSGTSLTSGQFRMIHTNDGSAPTPTNGTVDAAQFIVPNNTTAIGNFTTSPPMSVMGDWGDDGDTIRVGIFARRYYGTGAFNVLTSGGQAYQNPYRLWVEDIGPQVLNSWITPGTATVKKQYVKTFPATFTRLFRASGTARSDTVNAVQGYDKVYGDSRAYIGFADMTGTLSGVSASNIKKVEVYLYCNYTGLSTGGTAKIGFHGFTTAPATMGTMTTQLSTHFNRPQGRWVNLPLTTTPGNWITGTWRGITLGPAGTTSAGYYMRFNGYSNSAYKPVMRITYLK